MASLKATRAWSMSQAQACGYECVLYPSSNPDVFARVFLKLPSGVDLYLSFNPNRTFPHCPLCPQLLRGKGSIKREEGIGAQI